MSKENTGLPPKPIKSCTLCGSDKWWLRVVWGRPEWMCEKCHPSPKEG